MHPDLVDSIINAQISPDALLERFGQGQAELNKNQYQASSDHFTAAIDEATNSLSTLLLSRALAYANDGQHDHALADAYKVIEITPASADGYLCTGDIHIVTDNREKALRIYRNGVANANNDHPRYHSLTNSLQHFYDHVIIPANSHLLERLGKRITNRIFSYLPLRDRMVCAATCHTWRTYLFSWDGMWHHLRFTSGISTQCLDSLFARIKNGDQVKTCTIVAKSDDFNLAPQVLEHLVLGLKCRNLEALSVGNCGVKTTQWMIRLLRMNIKTMKSLALIKVAQQLYPVIHQVLDLCPGITKLAFDLHESWDGESKARNIDYNAPKVIPPSSTWKPRAPLALEQLKLTSSILRHRSKDGVYTFAHFLSTFLPHCPELCKLVVSGDMTRCLDGVIDALNAYCPKLRGLILDQDGDDDYVFRRRFLSVFAMRTMFLEQENLCDDFDQKLAALVMRIAPHIQHLSLDISPQSQLALKALGEIKTPKLENLILTRASWPTKKRIDYDHCNELACAIIQGCSKIRLKRIALHNLAIDDSVLDSFPTGLITLDLSIRETNFTTQGLKRCISRMHGLEKLKLGHYDRSKESKPDGIIDYELLHVIAQLPSIFDLSLGFGPENDIQKHIFSQFAKEVRATHPQLPLRNLMLHGTKLAASTFEHLTCLPNLEYLNVTMEDGIKTEEIKEILNSNRMNETINHPRSLCVVANTQEDKKRETVTFTFKDGEIVHELR